MLTSLCIENFAIVSKLELEFKNGMTAFTGETGAGKSIMIDALMLALGERTDASIIRHGAQKCEIQANFHCSPISSPMNWLKEHDIDCEDGDVFLRRIIFAEGRSKSYINGIPFPLQKVKELSEFLVDIHGQHQHQTLLKHATHRQQLDNYAEHQTLLNEVHELYHRCQSLKHQLEKLQNAEPVDEWADLLQYQIEELNALAIQDDEYVTLNQEHQLLHHAHEYLVDTRQIQELLNGDEGMTVKQQLHSILQLLSSLPKDNAHIQSTIELINNALIQCDEALDEVDRFVAKIQLDPERLQEVEARMSALHQAARKYHVDISQLLSHLTYLQKEYEQLQQSVVIREQLEIDYNHSLKIYQEAALKLRASRQQHAMGLSKNISEIIQKLGMPKGYVTIVFSELDKMQAHGLDKVEYHVCTNLGTTPDTLSKIASGGELSRISLGIQMVTAERGVTPTLLFDEVDVGIGGSTAALVGQMLRNLGERLQVFCVTHQPQVASSAHNHFLVEKNAIDNQTFSNIIPLQKQERIEEIARMLGGLTITEQTRSHARELLCAEPM